MDGTYFFQSIALTQRAKSGRESIALLATFSFVDAVCASEIISPEIWGRFALEHASERENTASAWQSAQLP